MQILLVSATDIEIQPFLRPENVDVLITGLGIAPAVYHLTRKLSEQKYDIAIQAGIAGSFRDLAGNVVIVERDTFADAGVEERGDFKSIFQMGLANENEFPFENGWLVNSELPGNFSLPKVKAVTLNKLSDSEVQKDQLVKKFDADIETMEGAAFHYVCLQQKIPFIQLRSISNQVGERDKSKWKTREAIEYLNTELTKMIKAINKQ